MCETYSPGHMDAQQNVEQLRKQVEALKVENTLVWSSAGLQIPHEELDVQDQIGGGGFALVHRGTWLGTPVAIKKWFDPQLTEAQQQEFRDEVLLMQQLRHPHVVQFLGACMRPPHLCMVTEHLPHSLHNVLHGTTTEVDRKRVVALSIDLVRALSYLHSRKPAVIHRDVKPANCLLDRAWRLKLCDFGLAASSRAQAGAGTPAYMAPELLGGAYGEKVDIYAAGIMINEMLTRQVPFASHSIADIKAAVLAGQRPEESLSCPPQLAALVRACWAQQPSERPSAAVLLEQLKSLQL